MLKNACLLAEIGADTAENEQHLAEMLACTAAAGVACSGVGAAAGLNVKIMYRTLLRFFNRMIQVRHFLGLVLGCIGTDFCK